MKYIYEYEMEVRDYECDVQGIVNNANYLHYTEHVRHKFLQTRNVNFIDLHNRGIETVVARVNMSFKRSLKSDDVFVCRINMKKEHFRYVFFQDIYRKDDNALVFKSRIDVVCLINNKLSDCEELNETFKDLL